MGELLQPVLEDPAFILARQLCGLFFIVFSVALVFWTWRDASKRGAMGWFWGLVVVLFNLAGWMVYMMVRPPEFAQDVRERELEIRSKETLLQRDGARCPACLKPVAPDFLICPNCMATLRKPCVECGRPLEMRWTVCPFCKERQSRPAGPSGRPNASKHDPELASELAGLASELADEPVAEQGSPSTSRPDADPASQSGPTSPETPEKPATES